MGDPYLPPHWAAHRFRDIFDVLEATLEIAAAFLRDFVFWMDGMGNAFAAPLFLVLGVAQVITLMLHLRWQRPLAKRRRQGGKATTHWASLMPVLDRRKSGCPRGAEFSMVASHGPAAADRSRIVVQWSADYL